MRRPPIAVRTANLGESGCSALSLGLFLCLSALVSLCPFLFITVAAIFLLTLAFVITNATFFLSTVLLIIAVFLPIAPTILASVINYQQVVVVNRGSNFLNVIARENGATQESSKDYCQYSSNHLSVPFVSLHFQEQPGAMPG
jgi:predicted membrane protein